jgi:hypothetical protein
MRKYRDLKTPIKGFIEMVEFWMSCRHCCIMPCKHHMSCHILKVTMLAWVGSSMGFEEWILRKWDDWDLPWEAPDGGIMTI